MPATLACLHHLDQPFLGLAERPLRAAGVVLDERRPAAGDALPALAEVDGILTFGGSQSVLDLERDPALGAERGLLRDAVEGGVPVLGICLGAQLLAHALGAPVRRAPRRVRDLDGADRPPGRGRGHAVRRARLADPGAAVERGRLRPAARGDRAAGRGSCRRRRVPGRACAWGVQFHPEVGGAALDGWYADYGAWLGEAGVSDRRARAADDLHLPAQAELAERLFGAFARVVAGASR